MSAFLGPIHYWLYRKIELQEKFVDKVVLLAEKEGINDLRKSLKEKYGEFDTRPLEEIIDGGNIHSWLQDKVSRSEYRLAIAVTTLLNKDSNNMTKLKEVFHQVGEEKASEFIGQEDLTLGAIYQAVADSLLDGMPCDRAVEIVEESDNEIIWKTVHCVHQPYWDDVDGDIENYYTLREAYLKGFAKGLGVGFEVVGDKVYSIKITR